MIYYLTLANRTTFSEYLEHWGRELAGAQLQILRYEDLVGQTQYAPGTYVFSMRDELEPAMGRFIGELAANLSAWNGATIYNDPRRTLRRFDLHAALYERGLNSFRSFRAAGEWSGVRFPVFVRAENSHDGSESPLLHSPAEIDTWIGRALALGRSLPDLMIVEFCDTADAGGWYRKYAAFSVGGRIVPRSMNYGRGWVLKFAGNEFSMTMATEELEYVRANPHAKELEEIFAIARTDYGRIDYSIKDGRVQTWEINLNPTIGRGLRPSSRFIEPELRSTREETKEAFYSRFNEAWGTVAAASPRADAFQPRDVVLAESIVEAARDEVRQRWRTRPGFIQVGVALLKPLMKTPARPLLKKLYRLPAALVRGNAASLFRLIGGRARRKG